MAHLLRMPKRSTSPSAPAPDALAPATPPPSRYRIAHYGDSRHWALYAGEELLAVTVYRRGALTVQERLDALEARCAALDRTPATQPSPPVVAETPGPAVQAVQQRRQATPEAQAAMVLALVQACGDDPAQLEQALVRHFQLTTARLR